jgi:hypothetical protein
MIFIVFGASDVHLILILLRIMFCRYPKAEATQSTTFSRFAFTAI